MVPVVGLEPTRVISPTDFESASSTNSNTPAHQMILYGIYLHFASLFLLIPHSVSTDVTQSMSASSAPARQSAVSNAFG